MLNTLKKRFPDHEDVLALSPEELAGEVLMALDRTDGQFHLGNILNGLNQRTGIYPRDHEGELSLAITEAWCWLTSQQLLVPKPGDNSGQWMVLSRRGRQISVPDDFGTFLKSTRFSKEVLHPVIVEKAWSNFIRGDYPTAVFQAFKEVEVAVRDAGGFDPRQVGVPLMRKAFHKDTGPLTNYSLPDAEKEALMNLFVGGIGSYKNPASHRTVTIEDPLEAGEMLILAGHLLRIVEDRAKEHAEPSLPKDNGV